MTERTMQEHFARWLVAEGLAEEHPGHGHVTGEQIAQRVFTFFDLWFKVPPVHGQQITPPERDENGSDGAQP